MKDTGDRKLRGAAEPDEKAAIGVAGSYPSVCALPSVNRFSGGDGPTVSILGGVHGDEIEGVLALRAVVARLATPGAAPLRGTLRWIAPAHPAAWAADTRACPVDGLNLARVFPGDRAGRPTEQVAAHITFELIAGSDLLIDLHSAGRQLDMALLCGFHSTGPLAPQAEAAAAAFAAPFTWLHPDSSQGRSLSAASELGIPSIYVEGHGGGQLRQTDLDAYVGGVLRVLAHLGLIDEGPVPEQSTVVTGDGNTDEGIVANFDGYFVSRRETGEVLRAGDVIGTVVNEDLQPLGEACAPGDGVLMLVRRNARVVAGDTLAIVAAVGGSVDATAVASVGGQVPV